jgi:hypothetical protein
MNWAHVRQDSWRSLDLSAHVSSESNATLTSVGFVSQELDKNARLVNDSQRPAYLLIMVQQWLNLVLDIVVMILAAVLTTLAVRMHSSSGFTGASLVTLMSFGESLSDIVVFTPSWRRRLGQSPDSRRSVRL